ncbi:hypothetical protein C1H46_006281 [Malus baccata]|uniref:RRM domain-containing protein n=1 Tax=Malus baccata TaxID=106549 RepID=A0A540NAT6_MALBA|nr:hypothetical protein C1H46_006281 [Malus baccata]
MEHPLESRGGRGLRRLDSKNGKAPPSRNLWLDDLSHRIIGDGLINPSLQFGELESVVFHAGRSYAFINFKREDEAIATMEFLRVDHFGSGSINRSFESNSLS